MRLHLSAPLLRLRPDEQLVALFRAGNEDAFRTIHDRYRARLFAYVRQMLGGSKSDAEDALQDVFMRAYGALRANDRDIALRAWLYRVAHNRCVDQLRRPVPHAADVYDVSRTPADEPATATERREDLRRLVQDVRRLPEQQRSVLLMREMEGLAYADLAAALDVTVPAVKSLLVRARMGLVQAAEARDTACLEVREDLATAHGRGVRANGRARRHLRDCDGCRSYRSDLRGRQRALSALSPVAGIGPLSVLAKLLGGGGAAGGAAGGGAVAGSGAVVGGSAAAISATKLAIVVGAAVVTAGGAVEVHSVLDKPAHVSARPSHAVRATPRAAHAFVAPGRHGATATGVTGSTPVIAAAELRAHYRAVTATADPLDGRPDALALAPTDPAGTVATSPTNPASATTVTGGAGGREIVGAVDSVPKALPPSGTTTGAQTGAGSQAASGQTTGSTTGTSSSAGANASAGTTTSGPTTGSIGVGSATGATTTTPTGTAAATGSGPGSDTSPAG